jgi:hypothetical protein
MTPGSFVYKNSSYHITKNAEKQQKLPGVIKFLGENEGLDYFM